MPDYEIFAPDDATMVAALQNMVLRQSSGRSGQNIFATDYYGKKYVQSGTVQAPTPIGGTATIPNMVAQPGVYCNVRWVGPTAIPSIPAASATAGVTIAVLASTFHKFAG